MSQSIVPVQNTYIHVFLFGPCSCTLINNYTKYMHVLVIVSHCSVVEALVVHAKKYLNSPSQKGIAPLHHAVMRNHLQICSILAAEVLTLLSLSYEYISDIAY